MTTTTFWIVSELYYPQETATGYLLTQLAEGLAQDCALGRPVEVICAMPHGPAGAQPPVQEERGGVHIHRCRATAFNKDKLLLRLANAATQSLVLAWGTWRRVRRGDSVLVVTNPPTLPFLVALICCLKHARCILLVHDIYPDAAVAAGVLRPDSWAVKAAACCNRWLYRSVDRIIVLGRDMRERIQDRMGKETDRVVVIPNWAEPGAVQPRRRDETRLVQEQRLGGKFIVQYAGNMARVNDVESLLDCAERLRCRPDVHFLFLGAGAKRSWLEQETARRKLGNVTLLSSRPRSEQPDFLNACDVGVVALCPGMYGVSVPSRTYNILAAGRPVLAIVERGSEIARMVVEDGTGWVVPPNQPEPLARLIEQLAGDAAAVETAGQRARSAAEGAYSLQSVLSSYRELLLNLD